MLCSLPTEIILCILNYVRYENHLDLIPLANTCRRFHTLVSDRTNWSGPVNIVIGRSSLFSARHIYKPLAPAAGGSSASSGASYSSASINLRTTCVNLAIERPEACDHVPELLRRFHLENSSLRHLVIYTPSLTHTRIVERGLSTFSCPNTIETITIRDPHDHSMPDDNGPQDDADHTTNRSATTACWKPLGLCSKEVLVPYLSNASGSLKVIDMPACPLDWLLPLQLDQLESLTVSCTTPVDGPQLKHAFPRLKDLTLYLARADQFSLLRPLLSEKRLYPWIESITVICQDDLRAHLTQEEISELLVSLDGVSRINAGWDMVAINAL
ncbi:hypothetical protein BX666DRAFT_1060847 [Dichotomocladium elegans]|nr:hypothetical protein BX666DRAFT_1060847 [Dichotomocladium elegans]